jgi:hypothetical protein
MPGFPVKLSVLEPAAGEGHMVEVLREDFDRVRAPDVFDCGAGYEMASFVGNGADVLETPVGGISSARLLTSPETLAINRESL